MWLRLDWEGDRYSHFARLSVISVAKPSRFVIY
jgi:hypothetical protein